MKKIYMAPACVVEQTQAFELIATSINMSTDKADKDYEGGCDSRSDEAWDIWED